MVQSFYLCGLTLVGMSLQTFLANQYNVFADYATIIIGITWILFSILVKEVCLWIADKIGLWEVEKKSSHKSEHEHHEHHNEGEEHEQNNDRHHCE